MFTIILQHTFIWMITMWPSMSSIFDTTCWLSRGRIIIWYFLVTKMYNEKQTCTLYSESERIIIYNSTCQFLSTCIVYIYIYTYIITCMQSACICIHVQTLFMHIHSYTHRLQRTIVWYTDTVIVICALLPK